MEGKHSVKQDLQVAAKDRLAVLYFFYNYNLL